MCCPVIWCSQRKPRPFARWTTTKWFDILCQLQNRTTFNHFVLIDARNIVNSKLHAIEAFSFDRQIKYKSNSVDRGKQNGPPQWRALAKTRSHLFTKSFERAVRRLRVVLRWALNNFVGVMIIISCSHVRNKKWASFTVSSHFPFMHKYMAFLFWNSIEKWRVWVDGGEISPLFVSCTVMSWLGRLDHKQIVPTNQQNQNLIRTWTQIDKPCHLLKPSTGKQRSHVGICVSYSIHNFANAQIKFGPPHRGSCF